MGTATLLLKRSWSSSDVAAEAPAVHGEVDSTMELERPGVEKKKRWEANTVAKSTAGAVSEAEEGEWVRDLEAESELYS